jgi:hypothetical protein
MAGVIKKPEALNLSGNLNEFVLSSSGLVSFILKKGDDILLQQSYEPGPDNLIRVDVQDVVEGHLTYTLNAGQPFYIQNKLAETFVATIDGTDYSFRVIRSGVANLADTAANWLKLHFLTWQPRVKPVTYYSPEWLTYYAVEDCTAKLKATYPDKSIKEITLGTCVAGHATTMNLQYSVVAGKLGNTYPSYYEVWTENSGTKLSESQVYAFSDPLAEDEQWYLFENSLGGLDSFRAAGTSNLNAEHEHNIAVFGDVREEYQVDTQRKYTKNTGYLDEYSRRWLLDFFPSKAKFVYEATAIRKIVVTESNVTYISNELPSSYTFTWQLSEVSSFLNLTKNESDIPDNLVAPDLSSPDFILPPRLAEFPRVQLTEGVLIPAFDPFNPKPTVTTYGAIHNTIKNAVIKELEDEIGNIGGGGSGGDCNLEIIESTDEETIPTDFNVYSALKSKLEDEKKALENENKYIRKDKVDETDYRVDFHDGITTGHYVGGFLGDGSIIDKDGNAEMTSLKLREFLEVPELRFNRIDVVSGELWNAIAFGLIEEVDEVNQIVKLKLEEGELSGMHLSDFCRGIFHNLTDNETAPGIDGSGFDVMVGFRTSYFTPVEIIDNAHFKYELKPGTTVHPCMSMKFAVYGNPIDKNRQSSAYHTRTYTRYLRGVNTWKIETKHISMQLGDLSNLIINGESLVEGSVYLNNVYFGGNVWYTPEQKEDMKGNDAYSVTLSTYSAVYNIADGIYEQVDVVSGENKVITGANQVVASQFNVSTRLQVSKGPEQLRFSDIIGSGKYIVTSSGTNCTYVITDGLIAVRDVTEDKAEIKIEVNCEGIAVYEVVFTIVRVADGRDGKDYEYIYTRTATEVKPMAPATSQVDDFVPAGWTDDSIGPTLELPFEWVCKRVKREGLWRDYSIPSLWARFGEDGTDYEYIYTRTTTQSRPSTPATSQNNDYVPSGWTDDPIGPTSGYPYEWICKRAKVDSVWGVFSTPALWSKFAEDGTDHEFIYRRTTSYNTPATPATSQTDDYVPSGWTDDPIGVTSTYIYEWMSKRDKVNGVWGVFSTPSLWAKFGIDGQPGTDGRYQEDRYRRSTTRPSTPSGTSPSGWSLDPPTSGSGPVWASRATFNGNGSLYRSWSVPVQWTGGDGNPGNPGPAVTTRGDYSSSKQYVGNEVRVDVVKYGGYWYIAKTTAGAFTGQTPSTTSSYWTRLQGQYESIATGLLIADEANIAGWRFKSNYIESQNSNVVLDGAANGSAKIALGAGYSNRDNAPTRLYDDGRINTKKLIAEDGCKIGGFSVNGNWLTANSDLSKDGAYINLKSPTSRIAFGRDLVPSTAGGTSTVTSIIENNNTPASFLGGTQNTALYAKAGGSASRKIAVDAMGNVIARGGIGVLTLALANTSTFPYREIHTRNEFYFQPSTYSYMVLPTFDQITEAWGGYNATPYSKHPGDSFIYKMTVVLSRSGKAIDFRGSSSAPLVGWGGGIQEPDRYQYGTYTVQPGGALTFFYINRTWYILKGF